MRGKRSAPRPGSLRGCHGPRPSPTALAAAAFLFAGAGAAHAAALAWEPCGDGFDCATADVPLDHDEPGGAQYAGPFDRPTAAPLLLVNSRFDAASSHERAQLVERTLGAARLLTIEGAGHTQATIDSPCADAAIER